MHRVLPIFLAFVLLACQDGLLRPGPGGAVDFEPPPMPTAWRDIVVRDLNPPGAVASAAVAVSPAGDVLLRVSGAGDAWVLVTGEGVEPVVGLGGRPGMEVTGMSDRLVAGTWEPAPGEVRPFVLDRVGGVFMDLGPFSGRTAAVSPDGVVAGWAVTDDAGEAAFIWDAGAGVAPVLLANLPGHDRCRAEDLAGPGLVVGVCSPDAGGETAVAWIDSAPVALEGMGGTSRATAVNAAGRIAGVATDAAGRTRVVEWNGAAAPPARLARVDHPQVAALTDDGAVLGQGDDSVAGQHNAFLLADGAVSWLPGLDEPASVVAGGADVVLVGRSPGPDGRDHAVRWTVDVLREPAVVIGRMARVVALYAGAGSLESPDARRLVSSLDTALDSYLAGNDRFAIAVLREFMDQLERLVRERRMAGTDARPLVNGALTAVTIIQAG